MPSYHCFEIFFTEHFVTNFSQICDLVIINGNKNHAVIPQEVCRQTETGVHHIEPVGVIAAHGFRVALGGLLGHLLVPGHRVGKVISIDEIVAGVVGRVDVDHLLLAVVGRLQQLQDLQVVALNVEVLGGVPVHTFLWAGTQGASGTLLSQPQAVRLALPLKLVLLKVVVDVLAAQGKQFINVQFALADALREYRAQLVQVSLFYVHGKSVHPIHLNTLHLSSRSVLRVYTSPASQNNTGALYQPRCRRHGLRLQANQKKHY